MAGVPQYEPQETPQPLPTPFDSTHATADSFGAPLGDALQDAGGLLAHVALKAKQDADTARVMKSVGDFGQTVDSLLHAPGGTLTLQGEQALAASAPTMEKIGEMQQKVADGLTPDQRRLFLMHSQEVLRSARRQVEIHTSGQIENLKTLGLLSTQKSMLDASVKAIDQTSADNYVKTGMGATRAYWTEHANDQVADEKAREYVGTVNAARLDRLLANPSTAGEAIRFFQSRHDLLPAEQLDTFEKKVAAVTQAGQAQLLATGIVQSSMGKDGQVDQRKAQGQVDALQVPEAERHLVQQIVDHHSVIYDKAWKDEATNLAAKVIEQARDPVTGELSLATVNPSDMAALEQKWRAKANELRKGVAIEGAKGRYASAVEHFFGPDGWENTARMTPQQFVVDSQLVTLPAKHRTALIERYQAQQKHIGQPPDEAVVLDEARKALGLGKKAKIGALADEKKQAFADLFDAVRADAREFAITNSGQKADREKIREYTRQEMLVVDSGFFRPTVRRFQQKKPPATAASQPDLTLEQILPLPTSGDQQ